MLDKNKIIKVTNRSNSTVYYEVPDLQVARTFSSNETKEITTDEIVKLSYIPGGITLIKDCLIINDEEVVQVILGEVEPEYFYTDADILELLTNGSLDQLKDCLEFGGPGVIAAVQKKAVDIELNDMNKRKAIYNATGFNVTKAIEVQNVIFEGEEATETKSTRRAAPITPKTESKYKVIKR